MRRPAHRGFPSDAAALAIEMESLTRRSGDAAAQCTARLLLHDCALAGTLEKHANRLGPLSDLLPFCDCACCATWKRRFFVLKGEYLFRFSAEDSDAPKGVPIGLLDARIRACDDPLPSKRAAALRPGEPLPRAFVESTPGSSGDGADVHDAEEDDWESGGDDESSGFCFEIWTLRKVFVLRAASAAARDRWIAELRQRKQLAIKERMGHAPCSASTRESNQVRVRRAYAIAHHTFPAAPLTQHTHTSTPHFIFLVHHGISADGRGAGASSAEAGA